MNMYQVLCIAVVYLILSLLDKKYVSKEEINYKDVVKNTIFVASSAFASSYIVAKINPEIQKTVVQAFTSEPSF
jgi:hypothetical protein